MSTQPIPPPTPPGGRATPPPPPPSGRAAPPVTGLPAYGTKIQVSTTGIAGTTFATIAGVGDITGPQTQVAEVETTSHSTGSPHRTFIPSLIDDGQISFPMYWQPTDPTQDPSSPYSLQALFEGREVTTFQLINTDAVPRTRTFPGFVKQMNEKYPVAGLCTFEVIIRIAGAPTEVNPGP